MHISLIEANQIVDLLANSPKRIASLAEGVDASRFTSRADASAWSANEVLAHLRACSDMWGKSIRAMLEQDHPTLGYLSPRTWVKRTDYLAQDFRLSFEAYTRQREDLVTLLNTLDLDGWSRGATFTGTIKGREATVFAYARRLALHESEHFEQLEAALRG